MIQHTIESCIREFDFCKHDVHAFHDLEEDHPAWPAALAEIITHAVRDEINAVLKIALDARFEGIPG